MENKKLLYLIGALYFVGAHTLVQAFQVQQIVPQGFMTREKQLSPLLRRRYEALCKQLDEQLQKTAELPPHLKAKAKKMRRLLRNVGAASEAATLQNYITPPTAEKIVINLQQDKQCSDKEQKESSSLDLTQKTILKNKLLMDFLNRSRVLRGYEQSILAVAWSQVGQLAAGAADMTIKIWSPVRERLLRTLRGHTSSVAAVAWSPDGTQLASASLDHTIKIWDVATGTLLHTLLGHTDEAYGIAWSPDGTQLASCSLDGTVKIWNPATGTLVRTLAGPHGHRQGVVAIAWSPDGALLASGSLDGTIKIWDPFTGRLVRTLPGHNEDHVWSLAWANDSTRLASGYREGTVKIWNPFTGTIIHTVRGHVAPVHSLAWSHDSSQLASGSDDRTIKIWDSAAGALVRTLAGHTDWVSSIAWSPDDTQLASASHDKTIRIWQVDSKLLQLTAKQIQFIEKILRTECLDVDHATFLCLPAGWQVMLKDAYKMAENSCVIS